jgi:hypothetical protein
MSFKLNKLSTTLALAGHHVTLRTDHFDAELDKEGIKKKLEEGVGFSTGDTRLGATLKEIATWIEEFETGLRLPDGLEGITGTTALEDVSVVITELSVTFSTEHPKFSIGLEIDFDPDFYKGIHVPEQLTKWFSVESMGISMSYVGGKEPEKPDDKK